MSDIDLTPTEDLLIDGLVARTRLGEPFWTYEKRYRAALRSLEAKGLISTEPASTPHIEATLTPLARDLFMSGPYTPPGAKVEWAVQTADDMKPVHYVLRCADDSGSEEYHRKMACRTGGALFRRAVPVPEWERVVEAQHG